MAKNKTGKHLQFYINCSKKQEMPRAGLCCCAWGGYIKEEVLELFQPESASPFSYWARRSEYESPFKFNILRQTIVLFMAAINNEL